MKSFNSFHSQLNFNEAAVTCKYYQEYFELHFYLTYIELARQNFLKRLSLPTDRKKVLKVQIEITITIKYNYQKKLKFSTK